jgi:twinkle protein
VVSRGDNLAFEYRQNGVASFLKVRKQLLIDGKATKTYWIEPKDSALCFWNEDVLSEPSDTLTMTEGELDGLSFVVAGLTHVVSVPNGSPFDKPGVGDINPMDDRAFRYLWDGAKLKAGLQQFKKIILATDDDQKGRVLRDELAVRLGRSRCWFVIYPKGCKDANEVLVAHGVDALQKLIAEAKPIVPSRLVSFSEIPSREDGRVCYSVGYERFDHHFMVVPPQLIVVTGKPNHGKSEWVVVGVVANLARLHGLKGTILQFEDNPDRNRRALIRYAKAWSGQKNGIVGDPVAWVDEMFKTISPNEDMDEENDFNLAWLKAAIEEAATRHGCRWVVIDPWNEVEHLWGKQDTEATYLNRALRELKRLGRRFQITIIIVAHPTKEGGKASSVEEASLYDINGGAVWNNKADLGVIVWADDVSSPDRWVKVAKSKDFIRFGQPGIVRMRFDAAHSTYVVISKGA